MADELSQDRVATRIWLLQYGPCWCRTPRTETSSFDYVRLRTKKADLGRLEENLLIVSERVIDGTAKVYRQVYDDVPDPKLVISAAACPTADRFWDGLPNGWVPVDEILPIDIHVDACISGEPESLAAAVLGHVLQGDAEPQDTVQRQVSLSG
ncbi:MAG: hypothetical protein ACLFRT_00930 [Actinomycetota bacterium]